MPGSSKTERKSRLMVNHILLTFAALKLIQRDKTEIAAVATKNQGTAAKKYVTWSGILRDVWGAMFESAGEHDLKATQILTMSMSKISACDPARRNN